MGNRGEVMIVDDTPANLQLLAGLLEDEGYMVRPTRAPEMAIESALANPPNLILLDIMMPGMDGFEVCRKLKENENTANIPIIFITALQGTQDRLRGFEVGGVDFITKPIRRGDVLARVSAQLVLYQVSESRKQAVDTRNKELEENESKYRSVFETSDDAIILLNEHTCFDCNSAALKMFGNTSRDEFMVYHLSEFSPETQADGKNSKDAANEMITLAYENKTHSFEWIFRRSTGENFPAEVLLTRIALNGQDVIQATVWDISKRKQIEYALKKSEERLKVIGAGTKDFASLLDDEDSDPSLSSPPNKNRLLH